MSEPTQTEETAVLNCRVRRRPASLAGMHYWLEPGKRVFVFFRNAEYATVSTVPEKDRISEDCFRVPISAIEIQNKQQQELI